MYSTRWLKCQSTQNNIKVSTQRQPNTPPQPVRRQKNGNGWRISNKSRTDFIGGFWSGIMFDVAFDAKAVPMACVPGYDSTGEAIGTLLEVETPTMPPDAVRTIEITYDPKKREFQAKDGSAGTFTTADYLILKSDGTAIAGWRQK